MDTYKITSAVPKILLLLVLLGVNDFLVVNFTLGQSKEFTIARTPEVTKELNDWMHQFEIDQARKKLQALEAQDAGPSQ